MKIASTLTAIRWAGIGVTCARMFALESVLMRSIRRELLLHHGEFGEKASRVAIHV